MIVEYRGESCDLAFYGECLRIVSENGNLLTVQDTNARTFQVDRRQTVPASQTCRCEVCKP